MWNCPAKTLVMRCPKSLLSYKMMVVEKALGQLRADLETAEKNNELEQLNQLIMRIQSLGKVKIALSKGLGGRTIIR